MNRKAIKIVFLITMTISLFSRIAAYPDARYYTLTIQNNTGMNITTTVQWLGPATNVGSPFDNNTQPSRSSIPSGGSATYTFTGGPDAAVGGTGTYGSMLLQAGPYTITWQEIDCKGTDTDPANSMNVPALATYGDQWQPGGLFDNTCLLFHGIIFGNPGGSASWSTHTISSCEQDPGPEKGCDQAATAVLGPYSNTMP